MNQLTQEWVDKAEGDFHSASREVIITQDPNYDAVCFHAQQCVEKYFKGCLQNAGIEFPKSHDLVLILDLLMALEPNWNIYRPSLRSLSTAAVEIRYPGRSADQTMANNFYDLCVEMRKISRSHLKLTV
jgi:HEPN domain-containing protein